MVARLYRALLGEQSGRQWLIGVPITALLAISLISSPLENPATLILAAVLVGRIIGASPNNGGDVGSAIKLSRLRQVQPKTVALLASSLLCVCAAVSWPETPAGLAYGRGEALDRLGRLGASAQSFQQASSISDRSPKIRIRVFTQTIIAGPSYWMDQEADLDQLYEQAATASPNNSVVIDLRLKQRLSTTGLVLDRSEIERLLATLKRNTGRSLANAFVLEAAFALQIGDRDRAKAALATARERIRDPSDKNDGTNLENIRALEALLVR